MLYRGLWHCAAPYCCGLHFQGCICETKHISAVGGRRPFTQGTPAVTPTTPLASSSYRTPRHGFSLYKATQWAIFAFLRCICSDFTDMFRRLTDTIWLCLIYIEQSMQPNLLFTLDIFYSLRVRIYFKSRPIFVPEAIPSGLKLCFIASLKILITKTNLYTCE